MVITAKGQARHRFWGEYSAAIALIFDRRKHAEWVQECFLKDWDLAESGNPALVKIASKDETDAVVEVLTQYGAEKKKILSIAKSIDYGEPFECTFDVADPNQMSMFEQLKE